MDNYSAILLKKLKIYRVQEVTVSYKTIRSCSLVHLSNYCTPLLAMSCRWALPGTMGGLLFFYYKSYDLSTAIQRLQSHGFNFKATSDPAITFLPASWLDLTHTHLLTPHSHNLPSPLPPEKSRCYIPLPPTSHLK
jgi:hypothetical protein